MISTRFPAHPWPIAHQLKSSRDVHRGCSHIPPNHPNPNGGKKWVQWGGSKYLFGQRASSHLHAQSFLTRLGHILVLCGDEMELRIPSSATPGPKRVGQGGIGAHAGCSKGSKPLVNWSGQF